MEGHRSSLGLNDPRKPSFTIVIITQKDFCGEVAQQEKEEENVHNI